MKTSIKKKERKFVSNPSPSSSKVENTTSKTPTTKGFKWHSKYHKLFTIPPRNRRPPTPPPLTSSEMETLLCAEGFCLAPFQNAHRDDEFLSALARPPAPYRRWSAYLQEFSTRRWGPDGWQSGIPFHHPFGRVLHDCGRRDGECPRCRDIAEWMRRLHYACGECRSCVMLQRRVRDYCLMSMARGVVTRDTMVGCSESSDRRI
ncbi:hypothetical protein ACHAXS_009957 [Conticribra weissflogii]